MYRLFCAVLIHVEMDLYSGPKIFYEFPDLDEVDEDIYEEYKYMYDWVLLGDALEDIQQNYIRIERHNT